jgi:bacterial/archaeal transporter family-2 protein
MATRVLGSKAEMNKVLIFYFFTLLLGIVLDVHLAMNSEVGKVVGNPRVANAVFWCIGALAAVMIGLTGWQGGVLNGIRGVNPVLLTAGALGAGLVFAIIWLIPQVGARGVFINLLAGQVIGGMILSHFGWLGSPVQRISPIHVSGAVIMIVGVALATYTR